MSLHNEMERLGRILAADAGIQVCVRGSKAYALPGKIVLPALDTFERLGQSAERMMHGLLDHEVGHALDTDFPAWKALEKESSFLRAVVNALEDGVIEARQGVRYRGAAQNMRLKNEWYWTEQIGKLKPAAVRAVEEPFLVAFVLALTLTVRVHGGRTIETFAKLRPHLGGLLLHCKPEIDALTALHGESKATPRVILIGRKIVQKAKSWPPEHEPKPRSKRALPPPPEKGTPEAADGDGEPDDGESFDEGDEGTPEPAEGDGEPGDDDGEPGDDDGEPGDTEPESGEPEAADEASESEESESEGESLEPDGKPKGDGLRTWEEDATTSPEDALKQQIEAKIEELYGDEDSGYLVESHEWDIEVDLTEQLPKNVLLRHHEELEEETRSATDALAQTFEAALVAMRERWPVHGADHGDVDPALLGEYAVGSATPDTIYQQFLAVDDRDVTVAVLVDCSGSMAGTPAKMATQGALAMSRALAQCGVVHEVCGFTTWDTQLNRPETDESLPWLLAYRTLREERRLSLRAAKAEMEAAGDDPYFYARTFHSGSARVPVHAVFKSYGSMDTRGLLNIGGYQHNLDGEAVLWQARRLAARPEARRIMFVLSDGMPIGGRSNVATAQHLRDVLKTVIEAGIEVYAIGIKSMHVVDLFPDGQWWVVRDLGELAQVAVTALTEALTNGRTERKWIKID